MMPKFYLVTRASMVNCWISDCEEWKVPSDDGAECVEGINYAMAIGIPAGCVVFIAIIVAIIIIIVYFVVQHHRQKKKLKNICVFKMKKSNVKFNKLCDILLTNKNQIN